MKKMFALVIAGSFLFAGCGSLEADAKAAAEKVCECTKAKDEDCLKEAKAELKALKDSSKDADPEEAKAAGKAVMEVMMNCK